MIKIKFQPTSVTVSVGIPTLMTYSGSVALCLFQTTKSFIDKSYDLGMMLHQGRTKTLNLVARTFYWPTLRKYVNRYVDGCDTCQRQNQHITHLTVCYNLYQQQKLLGREYRHILSSNYQLALDMMLFLWLLIRTQNWLISYLQTKQ